MREENRTTETVLHTTDVLFISNLVTQCWSAQVSRGINEVEESVLCVEKSDDTKLQHRGRGSVVLAVRVGKRIS